MTPKEKAQDLVDKMDIIHTMPLRNRPGLKISMYPYQIKQCALIAVDEIIKVASLIKVGLELDYWEQVKTEIEKL